MSPSRQLQLAVGDVVAAIRCCLDDAVTLAWRPVDALLASRWLSMLAALVPVAVAAGLFMAHGGLLGLADNAENLAVIGAAPYAAIRLLRRYRQIPPPKSPQKKKPGPGDS